MIGVFKQKLKEMIERIDFPVFIYQYETNRILGVNAVGRNIIKKPVKNIMDLSPDGARPRYPRELLENGSRIFNGITIYDGEKNIKIDEEVNCISVDNKHICIVLFQYSFRQNFEQNLSVEIPRIFWYGKKDDYKGINHFVNLDTSFEILKVIDEEENETLKQELSLYNRIHTIREEDGECFFIKLHRIAIINKNGTVTGFLGVYQRILDKNEYRNFLNHVAQGTYVLFEQEQEKNRRLSKMIELSTMKKSMKQILDAMIQEISDFIGIEQAAVIKHRSGTKDLQLDYCFGNSGIILHDSQIKDYYYKEYQTILKDIKKNGVVTVNQGEHYEPVSRLLKRQRLKAYLIFNFGIVTSGDGVFCFIDSTPKRIWTEETVNFMKNAVCLAKLAVQRNRLREENSSLLNQMKELKTENYLKAVVK